MAIQPPNPIAQGGFLPGIPQASDIPTEGTASNGCCGASSQATPSGCCGEPTGQVSALAGAQTAQGCCGEPAVATIGATLQASGCCGEPVSGSSSTQTGCCN